MSAPPAARARRDEDGAAAAQVAAAFATLLAQLRGLPPVAAARAAGHRVTLGGIRGGAVAPLLAVLAAGRGRALVITPTPESAEALVLDLAQLSPELPCELLPAAVADISDGPELRANLSERLVALASLSAPGDGLLVVSAVALLEELPPEDGERLALHCGQRVDRDALLASCVAAGWERVPLVAAPGEFSLRGDILDLYPWTATAPLRLEFLDEELEQIRRFDPETQRSVERLERAEILVGSPVGTGRASAARRRLHLRLPPDAAVFIADPARVRDRLAERAFEAGQAPSEIEAAWRALAAHPGTELAELDSGDSERDLGIRSVGGDQRSEDLRLTEWLDEGREILLLCDTAAEAERLGEHLAQRGLADAPRLSLRAGRLSAGFQLPAPGPVVVHHHELIGRRAVRRSRPRRVVASRALGSLAELQPGDLIVHLTHGVGLYRGMERLAREQGEEDFLVVEYADETRLYVPASRIDLVERFVGGTASGVKLDRIGGRTWKARKDKVARAVADMAAELLELQAQRRGGPGFAFPPDDALMARFEASFPWEDTPDQAEAWKTIRADMESPRPMDRLLVGDVGFGKTEVAVRAAFKAVLAGKQVAVLVPTTILAEQHFDTFARRMAEEPVRIEVLSRFRGAAEVATVLTDLAAGRVDIVIGTHKLLGAEVRFADLGLVVVDEEQRFGVAHKERLKRLRATVDVLTLSATPIPRTLHMALSGLRDIAALRSPPPGRRPVLTRLAADDDEVLRRALRLELDRGGQVFVLHNRIAGLAVMEQRVRRVAPAARVASAHGQLPSGELRAIVEDFARGGVDVLVCTSIIESGIDIPRANTIVVSDAQHFGLADLHQLRGRVGRENVQAHAWFLMPERGLPEEATRRLKAIEELSSLGSGLPIALRDLELRGAGNLLGAQQSGHILAVGYDMYCRLLRSAVASARGAPPEDEPGEIEVELGLTAFLPAEWVPDEAVRMSLLRRLARATPARLAELEGELADRFGRIPQPARALLALFRLRRMVRDTGLSSLLADGFGGVVLTVSDESRWERRSPFTPGEVRPVAPGRWRVEFPPRCATPPARLEWLLARFAGERARPSAPARR